jgi:pyruvate formate lyase activating enzyme
VKILLRKTSLIDYPGRISSVVFFFGCNLRCPWCQNRGLITGEVNDLINFEEAFAHLKKRQSVLGGVVLSGGEPCLQTELPDIIREIKNLSLLVKLDTNGMFPDVLQKLFSREETRPDYIALDLKIAPSRYGELRDQGLGNAVAVGIGDQGDMLIKSAALIRESGIAHEYRTLALPGGFISEKDIEELAPLTDKAPWYFRPFIAGSCLEPTWDKLEEPAAEARAKAEALAAKAGDLGKTGKALPYYAA